MHLGKLLSKWPYFVLVAIVSTLFVRNWVPGTFLTGWDNLHPEFNFKVNIIDRSLFSVWQEYQGLGLRAGNAHAADLSRQLFLYLLSFIFAPNVLRYLYQILALLVGTLGAFELLKRKVLPQGEKFAATLSVFLGSLFYLLNLGTLQYFYVPYEAFSHFWAALPWLILGLLTFLDKPKRKSFLFLTLVNLLAAPAFYIPTLFLVYLAVLAVILAEHLRETHSKKLGLLALAAIFAVNAYWLLPFAGFVAHGTDFVSQVKINRIFTEEAFLRNQQFGTLPNVALLKGFLFDTSDLVDAQGHHDFILRPWMNFLAKPVPFSIHYLLFAAVLAGFVFLVKTQGHRRFVWLTIFMLALFMLVNDNPPTGGVFSFLQNFPLFKEVFRFPYTKFVALASLTYAVGLAYFWQTLLSWLKKSTLAIGVSAVLALSLIYANLPSFQGHLFYAPLRQQIPEEYFELFKFFQSQPQSAKIANLPQPTFWGWTAYDWGYRGSGFPWYGIPQPILDRAFDVWNRYNEAYWRDIAEALYTRQTPEALREVLDKYAISFVWLDERVIMPGKPSLLAYEETKKFLASPYFEKVFSIGKQTVYRYKNSLVNNQVTIARSANIGIFPFGNLESTAVPPKIGNNGQSLTVSTDIPPGLLLIPGTFNGPTLVAPKLTPGAITFSPLLPKITLDGGQLPLVPMSTSINLPNFNPGSDILVLNNTVFDPTDSRPLVLNPRGNKLEIYAAGPKFTAEIGTNLYRQPLVNCAASTSSPTTVFGKDVTEEGTLALFGRASHPCVYARLTDLLPQKMLLPGSTENLLGFTLAFQGDSGALPTLCLSREGETSCFYQSEGSVKTVGQNKVSNFLVPLADTEVTQVWVKLELAAEGETMRRLTLRDFTFSFYEKPSVLAGFGLAPANQAFQYMLENPATLAASFDKKLFPSFSLSPADIPRARENCYDLGHGTFERKVATNLKVGKFVRYEATDASSCDQFPFFEPALAAGGIAEFTTRNISGRPLKACLAIDPPGYCLFEDILYGSQKNWQTLDRVVPPVGQIPAFQYFLNLDNYAVGPEKRVNDLAQATFTATPFSFLNSISVREPQGTTAAIDPDFLLPATDFSVSHPNPTFFQVKISTPFPQMTLVLNEAYDSGWLAWDGGRVLKHVFVNGWANGWDFSSTSTFHSPLTVILFFWPQLLEWLGLLLLPLPFLVLVIKKLNRRLPA